MRPFALASILVFACLASATVSEEVNETLCPSKCLGDSLLSQGVFNYVDDNCYYKSVVSCEYGCVSDTLSCNGASPTPDCPAYCDSKYLYIHGFWNSSGAECAYATKVYCPYGCDPSVASCKPKPNRCTTNDECSTVCIGRTLYVGSCDLYKQACVNTTSTCEFACNVEQTRCLTSGDAAPVVNASNETPLQALVNTTQPTYTPPVSIVNASPQKVVPNTSLETTISPLNTSMASFDSDAPPSSFTFLLLLVGVLLFLVAAAIIYFVYSRGKGRKYYHYRR